MKIEYGSAQSMSRGCGPEPPNAAFWKTAAR